MELKQYLIPLRKWWWLLIATTVVSTLSAFAATQLQDPLYQTKTTLMIGQAIEDPNPNNNAIFLTQQLSQSYIQMAQLQTIRQATMDDLGLDWLPEYRVGAVPNTQLLEITVIDTSPVRAQAVANTLAQHLVARSPTSTEREDQQRQSFISEQLDSLETNISETEAEIARLQSEIANMISARQIADTQAQIAALETKLNTLQTNYGTLLSNTREGAINTLRVIEPAPIPSTPVNANRLNTILLGAAIGLTLSAGAAYLMEYLDDTLKTPQEISQALDLPVIGFVAETPGTEIESAAIVAEQPRSPTAEAFRTLRTNLEFAAVDNPIRTLLITSTDPEDGKTTIATNLAISLAQGGKRVFLIDADLRRPRIHRFLNLANDAGLSDLFRNETKLKDIVRPYPDTKGVGVITSGSLPPNPTELLASERMKRILEEAKTLADTVIIDSPPFLVSDSTILAARTDGILLVMRPGRTNVETARATLEQLRRADARIVGIVLNRIPRQGSQYYSGYRYYYAPYGPAHQQAANGFSAKSNGQGANAHGASENNSSLLDRLFKR